MPTPLDGEVFVVQKLAVSSLNVSTNIEKIVYSFASPICQKE